MPLPQFPPTSKAKARAKPARHNIKIWPTETDTPIQQLQLLPKQSMFVEVIKRLAILSLLFVAYGALLTHNFVAHEHTDKTEHTSHHQHHDNDESPLSEVLSDIVHAPASTGSLADHATSGYYKFSHPLSFVTPAQVELQTPFVPPQKFQLPFREERVISFSVSNTQLRAPPTA